MAHRPPDPPDRSSGTTGAAGRPAPTGRRALLTTERGREAAHRAARGDLAPGAERTGSTAGDLLAEYLRGQAADFLRALRLHRESVGRVESAPEAARSVTRLDATGGRIGGALHTFRPLLDPEWADWLSGELGWLTGLLAGEYGSAARLERLLSALHRLSRTPERTVPGSMGGAVSGSVAHLVAGAVADPVAGATPEGAADTGRDRGTPSATGRTPAARGARTGSGAARAGALLERRLTLSRNRAHSAALRGLGSSRFHAAVDAVALLASEVPLDRKSAAGPAAHLLPRLVGVAQQRLAEAVADLSTSGGEPGHHPTGLAHALAPDSASESRHDAAWGRVRLLLRLRCHAQEVLRGTEGSAALAPFNRALDRQRDAVEAAVEAAAAARTPRIAPATAYALGVLHADQRHEAEASRFAFARLWHQGGGPAR